MKIKQILRNIFIGAFIVMGIVVSATSSLTASAECVPSDTTKCCGGVETSIIGCTQAGGDNAPVEETGIWGILLIGINILTAGVGLAAVGGVIYGAILYTSAGGSPEQVKKATEIITNVVIGVVAYALMYGGLNFIIPGGVFN